ncbi:sulfatase [Pelagicoccus mobilis]|uniref:Sulfatase n=1 Tax=Pelagicoccus mobilis TaxID=415221 RepID=A0A934S174_9BACT|nr:sulfatase [Pelagicoccus mobilis]MBK1880481.1 sulfatase [Pelagicoccus mobilis]
MKNRTVLLLLVLCCVGSPLVSQQKNVIFILADDLGWADTTLYGYTDLYQTPNLERLAKRGMLFNRAYSNSPLCSPTRASVLTGQLPDRHGSVSPAHHLKEERLQPVVPNKGPVSQKAIAVKTANRLDTRFPTLGQQLKGAGYATGHFGKWHLGREPYSPLEHGFDVDIPHWPGSGPGGWFVAPWTFPNFKSNLPKEHIEDRMAEEAIAWMASQADQKPFYLNFWQFSVHAPFDAKKSLVDYYRTKIDPESAQRSPTYAAMVHSLDDAIGALLDYVDAADIADDTIIIFASDNGGNAYNGIRETDMEGNEYVTAPTSGGPLRGGKATMFEGGIRIPCIVVWPGLVEPGSVSDEVIQSSDFYPTLHAQLGVQIPKDHVVDGIDISPALLGGKLNRDAIFTYFPVRTKIPDWLPPSMSVHQGAWKLIRLFHEGEDGKHEYLLYNLEEDIGETRNLAKSHPEVVKRLDRLMEERLKASRAVRPKANPAFDPAKYRPELRGIAPNGLKIVKERES